MGCIDLRRPSVSSPRTYNSPAARWSLRASPPSIPAVNSSSRGRTSAICSGVIPAREYEEPRNRGRVTSILNKVLLDGRIEDIHLTWEDSELAQVLGQGADALRIDFDTNLVDDLVSEAFGSVG